MDGEIGDDLDKIVELLHDAAHTTRLSAWEDQFLDDLRDRVVRFGERTFLSDRQRAALGRIEAKLHCL
jgi:hypothetical protein